MQVLSGLQHLQDVLLRHLHLPPHHPGEHQGQPLRRAGAPLHDGDWVVLIFMASGEQGQEELAVDCQDPTKYISSSMRSVSTVGGASRAGTVSSLCPGLTGLWAVKMHPKLYNVMGKRVAETHPNRIFPEAQKGQKPSASWASKPG